MNPISTLFNRFVDGLAALLAPAVAMRRARRTLVLVDRGDHYEGYRAGRSTPELIGPAELSRLRGEDVELRLAADRIVSRELTLPATSRDYLPAIIRNQLERLTPWAADRAVFDYAVSGEAPGGRGQVVVRVVATAREIVDAAVGRLAAAGLSPVAVGSAGDPTDRPSRIDLLGGKEARTRSVARGIKFAFLAWAGIVIVAGSFGLWRLADARDNAALIDAEISQNRRVVEAAIGHADAAGGYQRLAALKKTMTPAVVLLDDLTKILPDGTYLTEFNLDGGEVRLAGVSDAAPTLIAILQDSGTLTEVRFAAPTTRTPDGTEDSFQIVAKLREPGAPKS